jgi:hypothetical protein
MGGREMQVPVAEVIEAPTPAFFDTYGALYAFTLLWSLVGIAAIAALPAFAENTPYFLLLAWPPVAAMATLLLTEKRPGSLLGLAGRTLLLSAIASFATVMAITFAIPVFALLDARWLLAPRGVAGVTVGLVMMTVLIIVPLSIGLVRAVRSREGAGASAWLRAGAIVAALVVVGVVAYTTLVPGHPLEALVREDQAYALLTAVSWYVPGYALFTALARSFGLG